MLLYTAITLAGFAGAQSMSSMASMAMSSNMPMSSAMPMSSMASGSMSMQPMSTGTAMPGMPLKINVGSPSGGLVFQPNVVMATPGSTLEFHFYPMNHSVVQGMFDSACMPMDGGFYSGFYPSMHGEAPQVYSVDVTNSSPMWVYCSQGRHCQEGMAMVVNPDMSNTMQQLPQYLSAAAAAPTNETPMKGVTGGSISTQMNAATPTPTPTPGSGGSGSMGGSGSGSGVSGSGGSGGSGTMGGSGSMQTAGAAAVGDGVAWGVAGAVGMVGAYLL